MKSIIHKTSSALTGTAVKNTLTLVVKPITSHMTSGVKFETKNASISTDPDNRLTRGTDDGLFVSDVLNPDPLAYYILAKA